MPDNVLLCATQRNFSDCLSLARLYGTGLEIQTFGFPDALNNDYDGLLKQYELALRTFKGRRTMHGPFMDMASGSPDRAIQVVVRQRIIQSVESAARLGADLIVFHANFISSLRNLDYRERWVDLQVAFWQPLAEKAARYGVTLALENMWEFEPEIIAEVLQKLAAPNMCTCLDIGHISLYSDPQHNFDWWISVMGPYLRYTHLNNHDGHLDQHQGLLNGVIDYGSVLAKLRRLPAPPSYALEISDVHAMRDSLACFDLPLSVITVHVTD